jgi:hypothetical protein
LEGVGAILLFQVKSNFFNGLSITLVSQKISLTHSAKDLIIIKFDCEEFVISSYERNSVFEEGKPSAVESLSLLHQQYFGWCFITVWCGWSFLHTARFAPWTTWLHGQAMKEIRSIT